MWVELVKEDREREIEIERQSAKGRVFSSSMIQGKLARSVSSESGSHQRDVVIRFLLSVVLYGNEKKKFSILLILNVCALSCRFVFYVTVVFGSVRKSRILHFQGRGAECLLPLVDLP